MCMTNISKYTFIHLNLIVSFKYAHEPAYPQTVTDALRHSQTTRFLLTIACDLLRGSREESYTVVCNRMKSYLIGCNREELGAIHDT